MKKIKPYLVVSDGHGNVFDIKEYHAVGSIENEFCEIGDTEWIPLPEGSQLMELPGRLPVGANSLTGEIELLPFSNEDGLIAVSAFPAPAYTVTRHAAWKTETEASRLSLFAYCAVGWFEDRFYIPAVRVDPDIRQDPFRFDRTKIEHGAQEFLKKFPNNRLVKHLVNNCALQYGCPAAQNYVLNRWEMPLPTSRACNSRCLGCISFQPGESGVCSSQNRISFIPDKDEIIEIVIEHFKTASNPIASFGQGCEGEPLSNPKLLIDAVSGIRNITSQGTINLNTNGSKPEVIRNLVKSGLNSIRVSLNSAIEENYNKYHQPVDYSFNDLLKSMEIMKQQGGFVSINLFVFPGVTDRIDEFEHLEKLISDYKIDMIQWRNLNIDPEWYLDVMSLSEGKHYGVKSMIEYFKQKFPDLRHGYFNPYLG